MRPASRSFGRRPILRAPLALAFSALFCALGCQTYSDQLERGQAYYADNQYEQALATFRHLEADQDSLEAPERVRYCYLRGMTDYRLGYESDARYWLGLAKASGRHAKDSLAPEEKQRLDDTLAQLDAAVYGIAPPEKTVSAEGSTAPPKAESCEWTTDCDAGFICQDGVCAKVE